jgi:hypothetical protein
VSKAIKLLRKLRSQHTGERADEIWKLIYPAAIANYAGMNPVEQEHARQILRERVRWRLRDQNRRAPLK